MSKFQNKALSKLRFKNCSFLREFGTNFSLRWQTFTQNYAGIVCIRPRLQQFCGLTSLITKIVVRWILDNHVCNGISLILARPQRSYENEQNEFHLDLLVNGAENLQSRR